MTNEKPNRAQNSQDFVNLVINENLARDRTRKNKRFVLVGDTEREIFITSQLNEGDYFLRRETERERERESSC